MALKAKITAEVYAKLPDVLKAEYTERDGAWILVVDAVDGLALEDVGGIRRSLENERKTTRELKAQILSFEGLDPEKAREALTKVGEMSSWTPEQKVKEQIDAQVKQVNEKWTGEVAKREAVIKDLSAQLEDALIVSAATKAITDKKGRLRALLPHVTKSMRLVKNEKGKLVARMVDERGTELISRKSNDDTPMPVEEYVERLREDEDFAPMFDAPAASGSGGQNGNARGGGGGGKTIRIKRDDQDSINENWEKIATGEAVVVD
jgi:hypothetical protein